jgi:hypothetical protein
MQRVPARRRDHRALSRRDRRSRHRPRRRDGCCRLRAGSSGAAADRAGDGCRCAGSSRGRR